MNQRKKKAFTLTELLVVVVIIGVLAAVVLPKFNKVIETRKTTEAEEVMAAVRTEQERRCALDKPYIGNINKLVTAEVLPQKSSKNYTYSLEETGMLASSKGMSYELKMPSYADGRVCCEGADCGKLNKDYPGCSELQNKPDYQVATDCTATLEEPSGPEPEPKECSGSSTEPCGCEEKGERTRTCNHETGEWSAWSACSIEECSEDETISCDAWWKRNNEFDPNGAIQFCLGYGNLGGLRYEGGNMLETNADENAFIASCCGEPYCSEDDQYSVVEKDSGKLLGCCQYGVDLISKEKGEYACGTCPDEKRHPLDRQGSRYFNGHNLVACSGGSWAAEPIDLTAVYDLGAYADYHEVIVSNRKDGDCRAGFTGTKATQDNRCTDEVLAGNWCNTQCNDEEICYAVCYSQEPTWERTGTVRTETVETGTLCNDETSCVVLQNQDASYSLPGGYTFVGWISQQITTLPENSFFSSGSGGSPTYSGQVTCSPCSFGEGVAYPLTEEKNLSSVGSWGVTSAGTACLKRRTTPVSGFACVPVGSSRTKPPVSCQSAGPDGECFVD